MRTAVVLLVGLSAGLLAVAPAPSGSAGYSGHFPYFLTARGWVSSCMSRIARVVAVGLPHHVTQRGNNRQQVFFDDDDRRFYLLTLAKYGRKHGVDIWGYCLMDNHVHVLAVPEREESLARCFAGTNLVYTQYINRKRSRSGRLWQNRFFSCPVDNDSYLWPVLRYIERNPVRAGMVKQAWQYEWSSARHHAKGEPDMLVNEPDWFTKELRA